MNYPKLQNLLAAFGLLVVLTACSKSEGTAEPELAVQVSGNYEITTIINGTTTVQGDLIKATGGKATVTVSKVSANVAKFTYEVVIPLTGQNEKGSIDGALEKRGDTIFIKNGTADAGSYKDKTLEITTTNPQGQPVKVTAKKL